MMEMVSNELLDYLGEVYEAAHPEPVTERKILFVDFVERYVNFTTNKVTLSRMKSKHIPIK